MVASRQSAACNSASPTMQRSRPAGCADRAMAGLNKGMPPQRVKFRRREAAFGADQQRALGRAPGRCAAPRRARWRRSGGGPAASRRARRRARRGGSQLRHGQALALLGGLDRDGGEPIRVDPCVLPRSVRTGSSAATPSSVAFCTTRSVASRFSSANASQRSRSGYLRPAVRCSTSKAGGVAPQRSRCGALNSPSRAVEQQQPGRPGARRMTVPR